jgi:hypothetical protein
MAGSDEGPTYQHTTTDELRRQAESAFGGAVESGPIGVPGSDDARLRRRRRILIGFVALVLTIGTVVATGVLIASIDSDDSDKPASIPSLPGVSSTPGVPPVPEPPEQPEPAPSEPPSFFTTAGLRQGMAKARRLAGAGARVQLARITADPINVIAYTGSQRKIVLISDNFTRAITTASSTSTGREFPFSAIDPRAAARLDRAIDRPIDYMIVISDPISERVEWLVYPEGGGGHYEADARGGSVRRVG